MEKVFILDEQGNKVLPITHQSAVLDSQGNGLDSVLGAIQDDVGDLQDDVSEISEKVSEIADVSAAAFNDIKEDLEATQEKLKGTVNTLQGVRNTLQSVANAENITYTELKAKRDGGRLVAGMWYRITDYTTVPNSYEDAIADGHQFDLLVMALDGSHLSEDAKAVGHSAGGRIYKTDIDNYPDEVDELDYFDFVDTFEFDGETYYRWQKYEDDTETDYYILTDRMFSPGELSLENPEMNYIEMQNDEEYEYHVGTDGLVSFVPATDPYFENVNLNAWSLRYCLDNDTTRFSWAVNNGKGVIYRFMDDENIKVIDPEAKVKFSQHKDSMDVVVALKQAQNGVRAAAKWGYSSSWESVQW